MTLKVDNSGGGYGAPVPRGASRAPATPRRAFRRLRPNRAPRASRRSTSRAARPRSPAPRRLHRGGAAPARVAPQDVRDVQVSEGVGLEVACAPTGVELCFDARDNNCNGVIDEGCGLRTGILQFTIAWEAAEADVDLNVYDPAARSARRGATASGLEGPRLPARRRQCQGQNVENVFLAEGEPARVTGCGRPPGQAERRHRPRPRPAEARAGRPALVWDGRSTSPLGAATEEKAVEFSL